MSLCQRVSEESEHFSAKITQKVNPFECRLNPPNLGLFGLRINCGSCRSPEIWSFQTDGNAILEKPFGQSLEIGPQPPCASLTAHSSWFHLKLYIDKILYGFLNMDMILHVLLSVAFDPFGIFVGTHPARVPLCLFLFSLFYFSLSFLSIFHFFLLAFSFVFNI